jgi:hypothetical protein
MSVVSRRGLLYDLGRNRVISADDVKRAREAALFYLNFTNTDEREGYKLLGMTDEQLKVLDREINCFTVFEELDRLVIAPLVESEPEVAARAYHLIANLVITLSGASRVSSAGAHREMFLDKQRARGTNGGKLTGELFKQKQAEWTAEALPIAKKYVALNPRYSQAGLARHIERILEGRTPSTRQIISVIVSWQKHGLIPAPQD